MDFEPDPWPLIDRKTRNMIRKGEKELYARSGTIQELRYLHFDPTYLPRELKPGQLIYVAILENDLHPISAVLIEKRGDHIYYRYSGNNPIYKGYQGNSFLLWYIAKVYRFNKFKYFDLGGSAVPGIEKFKRGFSTSTYPLKKKSRLTVLLAKVRYHVEKVFQNGF